MDYFVLSGFGYWKYYIMLLYYRLAEYPPMVRFCAIFTTFFLISFVVLLFLDGVRTYRNTIQERHDRRARRRYQQAVVEMATTPQNLDPDVILERLDIPEDYKPRPRFVRPILQMLLDIYPKIKDNINKAKRTTSTRPTGVKSCALSVCRFTSSVRSGPAIPASV